MRWLDHIILKRAGKDTEEEIYKILKRKHKINKEGVEWIKLETPPFA